MRALPPPEEVRALAERLVAIPSASPEVVAETEFAAALRESLPAALERGEWYAPDGRPVLWARLRGRGARAGRRRAALLLSHYDTVGVEEFAAIGGRRGDRIAYDPAALRELFLRYSGDTLPPGSNLLLQDLAEEKAQPGTWMFGRGTFDMKSGIAAALAALEALAADESLAGDVLFVCCPDEEHASAGMLAAVPGLARLKQAEGLDLVGALNLDIAPAPVAYAGVMGKALAGLYVLGRPTHAGMPFEGVDAAQLAASLTARATASRELVDRAGESVAAPAVALKLRDLKPGYNVQTAAEAVVELNLITITRSLAETLDELRRVSLDALSSLVRSMRELASWVQPGVALRGVLAGGENLEHQVLLWPELLRRAGEPGELFEVSESTDPRVATLARIRHVVREAKLQGPAIVLHLLPPYHPHAAPGNGPLVHATRTVMEREGLEVRPFYPYITDASYLAWRAEPPEALGRYMPCYGREYALPIEAMRALDLDVVNLGPWGRDAHGLFERVRCDWAFGRLPGMVAEVVKRSLEPQ
jgi:arginine utilization protein RocB